MNQFKRAKQIGNQTESITDLKTAGVAPKKEESQKDSVEQSDNQNERHSEIPQAAPAPQTPIVTVKEPSVEQKPTVATAQEPIVEQKTTIATAQEPVTDNTFTPIVKAEEVVFQNTMPKTEHVIQPTIYHEISQPQTIVPQPTFQPPVNTMAIQQQQPQPAAVIEPAETYIEPVEPKTTKNNKKSAPNMFSQKTESKSIRKSLVLKPSSVKKAESYCAKNGGSFNELVQILLDKFIEEYDL